VANVITELHLEKTSRQRRQFMSNKELQVLQRHLVPGQDAQEQRPRFAPDKKRQERQRSVVRGKDAQKMRRRFLPGKYAQEKRHRFAPDKDAQEQRHRFVPNKTNEKRNPQEESERGLHWILRMGRHVPYLTFWLMRNESHPEGLSR
jgi:hypothetical protein